MPELDTKILLSWKNHAGTDLEASFWEHIFKVLESAMQTVVQEKSSIALSSYEPETYNNLIDKNTPINVIVSWMFWV